VGHVFTYNVENAKLVTMSVDLEQGDQNVTCQVIGSNGKVLSLGSFALTRGYGSWQFAVTGLSGPLSGARLVAADGTVLASAMF
jgi:hypothetical protein